MRRIFKNKKKFNFTSVFLVFALLVIFFISIGFASFSSDLKIFASAEVRVYKDIRINGITLNPTLNNAVSSYADYDTKSISVGVTLPQENSSVTYDVQIVNLGNVDMALVDIIGLPSDLRYVISDYNLGDTLCNDSICNNGMIKTIKIEIKYNDNINNYNNNNDENFYPLILKFDFRRAFSVSYYSFGDVSTSSFPKTVVENENLVVNFPTEVKSILVYSSNDFLFTDSYNFSNGILTVNNITDDITVIKNNLLINDSMDPVRIGNITITVLGDSTYILDGTASEATFIRLTETLRGGGSATSLLDGNLSTIFPSGTDLMYGVEVLGGTSNISQSNDFRVLARNLGNSAYMNLDLYDDNVGEIYTRTLTEDIALFSLFINSGVTFNNYTIKIIISENHLDISGNIKEEPIVSLSIGNFRLAKYNNNVYLFNGYLAPAQYYVSIEEDNFKIVQSVSPQYASPLYKESLSNPPRYRQGNTYKFTYTPVDMTNWPSMSQFAILFRDTTTSVSGIPYSGKLATISGVSETTVFSATSSAVSQGELEKDASMTSFYLDTSPDGANFQNCKFKLDVQKIE